MFRQITFFRRACVAVNLLCATSNSPANPSPVPPALIRAAVQQDARPAGRPTVQPISGLCGRDPAPAGECLNSDGRGSHANIEDLRRRLDADEAELRTLRAQLQQQRADAYTGGQTEEQRKAMQ
jgi:hypothetical protein